MTPQQEKDPQPHSVRRGTAQSHSFLKLQSHFFEPYHAARGILVPRPETDPRRLPWECGSQPLDQQGSAQDHLLHCFYYLTKSAPGSM